MFNVTPTDMVGMALAAIALIALSAWAAGFRKNPRNIIGVRNVFFAVSAALLVVSVLSITFKGFKWGMDFTGGTIMEVGFVQNVEKVTPERVTGVVGDYSKAKELHLLQPQVQVEENASVTPEHPYRKVIIRMARDNGQSVTTAEVEGIADELETKLGGLYRQKKSTLEEPTTPAVTPSASPAAAASPAASASPVAPTPETPEAAPSAKKGAAAKKGTEQPAATPEETAGTTNILSSETLDPIIGRELFVNAFVALLVALGLQLVYITLRFGNQIRYGIAADIALAHDVVIMAGLYSLAGRQVDSPFLAAVLTVIGYSVMDSIVVFDRIRENVRHARRGNYEAICNDSLNQTMSRSVNTTLTVIITLCALYFFGGDTLRNFAFALLVGVTSGAYSSIFVATPLVVIIDSWTKKQEELRVSERRAAREAARAADSAARAPRPEPSNVAAEREYQPKRRSSDATPLTEDYPDVEEMEADTGGNRAPARKRKNPRRRR